MRPQGVLIKQNLPGGTSAVVPPDPMPNSEVKRRSADGSVGSPHVRVGNCQASNKAEGSVERLGLLFLRFNKNPVPKGAGFFAVWGMPPGGAALTGATDPEPQNLVRSTVSRQTTMPVRYYQQ